MSATLIRRVIEVAIFVFFIGGFLLIARNFAAIWDGEFGVLAWPVQAGAYGMERPLGADAWTTFVDGNLVVTGQPFWYGVDIAFSVGYIALFIMSLMILRGVLSRFAQGDFVNAGNADSLARIGKILLLICALSVLHAVVVQFAILSIVEPANGTVLHPSISWDVKGATNIWLHYSPPIFTFILAGLALLFAEAIRAGNAYREDSESVV